MMKTRLITILIILLTHVSFSQNSYSVKFASELEDGIIDASKGDNDEYLLIKWKNYWGGIYDTASVFRSEIYSFGNNLADSTRWPFNFNRVDTAIFPSSILFDSNCYIVAGGATIRSGGDSVIFTRYQYIAKFDLGKQLVWEYLYPRPQELEQYGSPGLQKMMKLSTGNYFTITYVSELGGGKRKWLIQTYTPDGDTLQVRVFDNYLSGYLESLTYNYDSSEVLVHSTLGHIPGCNYLENAGIGAVILDTITYDTLGGICYEPNFHIENPYDAMLNPSDNLVIAGETWIYDWDELKIYEYFGVYVLDSNYNVINSTLLTDKDRKFKAGEFKCLDIKSNGDIYLAGIVDRNPTFFPETYNYIYLVRLDSTLNILTERYLGGDAYYWVLDMLSTTDGGILISGKQYDYIINEWGDLDAFVIKTDAGLWVNTYENSFLPVHSALVYPNPGSGTMNIRTTENRSMLKLYNLSGQQLLQTKITGLITEVDCHHLMSGVYIWKLFKNDREIDHGKWINIKQ